MYRNVAGQKVTFTAFDAVSGLEKTGDAANLTAYVSIDDGSVTPLGDTSASEDSSTNAKGRYTFDLTQAESNGIKLKFSAKSTTSGIVVIPFTVYTTPANYTDLDIEATTGEVTPLATAVRTAVGLATGNLDTQLLGVKNQLIHTGTLVSASSTAGVLDAGASSVNDFYTGCYIYIVSGLGAGQAPRRIILYVGVAKGFAISQPWAATPDNTSVFEIIRDASQHTTAISGIAGTGAAGLATAGGHYATNGYFDANLTDVGGLPIDGYAQAIVLAAAMLSQYGLLPAAPYAVSSASSSNIPNVAGTTDALGTTTTVISATFAGANLQPDDYYNGKTLAVSLLSPGSGNPTIEYRRIEDYDADTGTFSVDTAYSTAILSGSTFLVLETTPVTLTSGAYTTAADTLLDRDMSAGTDSGSSTFRTPRQSFRFLRNRWNLNPDTGALDVYKENDSDISHSAVVGSAELEESPVSFNPAGGA